MRRRRERQEDDVALFIGIAIWFLIVGMAWWAIAIKSWLIDLGWF